MFTRGRGPVRASWLACAVTIAALSFACIGCNPLGACEGTSGILGTTYCYDDWTEDECDDYDAEEVNDARWNFHAGETCSDLGL